MSKILTIYENIKQRNQQIQNEVHLFFNLLLMSDLEELTESRFTTGFILKMLYAFLNNAHIESIIDEIRNLEKLNSNYKRMKPPTQFGREPLAGLWHKHYEQVGISSMALNIKRQMSASESFDKEFSDIFYDQNISQKEKIAKLAYLGSGRQYLDRIAASQLTGEWIIYHIHNGKNYYLNISAHRDGDEIIAQEIKDIALLEFPFFEGDLPIFK